MSDYLTDLFIDEVKGSLKKDGGESSLGESKSYTDEKTEEILSEAKEYTDNEVANLVGAAPETLDTLEELANAMKDNSDVVEVLNEAIGNKAAKDGSNAEGDWNINVKGSASTLRNTRYIDGIPFDGSDNISRLGTCTTSSSNVSKEVTLTAFDEEEATDAILYIQFAGSYDGSAANDTHTISINGGEPLAIYYQGEILNWETFFSSYPFCDNQIHQFRYFRHPMGSYLELIAVPNGRAKMDGNGKVIADTYAKKIEVVTNNNTFIDTNIGVQGKGWYRIARFQCAANAAIIGAQANSCNIFIKRLWTYNKPEYHEITLAGVYDRLQFIPRISVSEAQKLTKIRYTTDGENNTAYIEIYWEDNSYYDLCCIGIEDTKTHNGRWITMIPEFTQETVDGISIYTVCDIPANSKGSATYDSDGNNIAETYAKKNEIKLGNFSYAGQHVLPKGSTEITNLNGSFIIISRQGGAFAGICGIGFLTITPYNDGCSYMPIVGGNEFKNFKVTPSAGKVVIENPNDATTYLALYSFF